MFCPRCGTESLPGHKFCKNCGAEVAPVGSAQATDAAAAAPPAAVTPPAAPPPPPPAAPAAYSGGYQPPYQGAPAPPPGMVPVMYQAYPGGPQQVYYVPAQGAHAHAGGGGFLEGIRAKIRDLASTDKLEGFSLSQTFSDTFKRHGSDAIEEYMMVGSSRTTPPIEMVETGWPRPWMFFRLLGLFVIAFVACDLDWKFAQDPTMVPALMIMGAFGVPIATLALLFEMNTPRNVSIVEVGKLFVVGGLVGLGAVAFEYMIPIATKIPGIIEETAKFAAVLMVVRGTRYKYELNGVLFGAAVGAGFASFETAFYGLSNAFIPGFVQALQQGGNEMQAYNLGMQTMVSLLAMRGVLAPFGHVAWTAIAAGAFWRVKGGLPTSMGMLSDSRFLKAFIIPVAMHTLWDASILVPTLPTAVNMFLWVATGATSWYVLFGLVQQGLQQVKSEQQTQLQSTLARVEATMGPGARAYAAQPQGPVSA